MGGNQFEYWQHTASRRRRAGEGSGFSWRHPKACASCRSRMFTDEEIVSSSARGCAERVQTADARAVEECRPR